MTVPEPAPGGMLLEVEGLTVRLAVEVARRPYWGRQLRHAARRAAGRRIGLGQS